VGVTVVEVAAAAQEATGRLLWVKALAAALLLNLL
jgi:hypothetical protein